MTSPHFRRPVPAKLLSASIRVQKTFDRSGQQPSNSFCFIEMRQTVSLLAAVEVDGGGATRRRPSVEADVGTCLCYSAHQLS